MKISIKKWRHRLNAFYDNYPPGTQQGMKAQSTFRKIGRKIKKYCVDLQRPKARKKTAYPGEAVGKTERGPIISK